MGKTDDAEGTVAGPPGSAASERLDALDPDLRWTVRRRFGTHVNGTTLTHPVLAAAVVAVARRRRRWIVPVAMVAGIAFAVLMVLVGDQDGDTWTRWAGPLLGLATVGLGFARRHRVDGVITDHLAVLADHGSVPPPGPAEAEEERARAERIRSIAAWALVPLALSLGGFTIWKTVAGEGSVPQVLMTGAVAVVAGGVAVARWLQGR